MLLSILSFTLGLAKDHLANVLSQLLPREPVDEALGKNLKTSQ